jgi:hypothetical protein
MLTNRPTVVMRRGPALPGITLLVIALLVITLFGISLFGISLLGHILVIEPLTISAPWVLCIFCGI